MENEILQQILSEIKRIYDEIQSLKDVTPRMETNHGNRLDALFDGYQANYEIVVRCDSRVAKPESLVEKRSIEIRYLTASLKSL